MTRTTKNDLNYLLKRISDETGLELDLHYQGGLGVQLQVKKGCGWYDISRFQTRAEMYETLNTFRNILDHMNRKEGN